MESFSQIIFLNTDSLRKGNEWLTLWASLWIIHSDTSVWINHTLIHVISHRSPWFCIVCSRTPPAIWDKPSGGSLAVPSLRNAALRNHPNTFHKLNPMLSAAFVTLVGTWKSCIDITLSKPWNTDITVINGLLKQFWRSRESPKPSVPYRQKWEPAYCISMMFFPLNSIMGVCVFFPSAHTM